MGVLRYTYYEYQSETALGVAFQLTVFYTNVHARKSLPFSILYSTNRITKREMATKTICRSLLQNFYICFTSGNILT